MDWLRRRVNRKIGANRAGDASASRDALIQLRPRPLASLTRMAWRRPPASSAAPGQRQRPGTAPQLHQPWKSSAAAWCQQVRPATSWWPVQKIGGAKARAPADARTGGWTLSQMDQTPRLKIARGTNSHGWEQGPPGPGQGYVSQHHQGRQAATWGSQQQHMTKLATNSKSLVRDRGGAPS